jgi:hypothetical protein
MLFHLLIIGLIVSMMMINRATRLQSRICLQTNVLNIVCMLFNDAISAQNHEVSDEHRDSSLFIKWLLAMQRVRSRREIH